MKGLGWMVALGLLLAAVAACGPGPDAVDRTRPAGLERIGQVHGPESPLAGPPEYHRPLDWWRVNHPLLVAGKPSRGGAFFSQGECLACHVPERSCRVCHQYVGAPKVEGEQLCSGGGETWG